MGCATTGLVISSISGTSILAVRRQIEAVQHPTWFPVSVMISLAAFFWRWFFLSPLAILSPLPLFLPLFYKPSPALSFFCPVRMLITVLLTLTDDQILIQMGAVREGQTDEEKETYILGLKEIINEMRRDKVKDFSTVANEIAAYRRRFLQDPSRVLPL